MVAEKESLVDCEIVVVSSTGLEKSVLVVSETCPKIVVEEIGVEVE